MAVRYIKAMKKIRSSEEMLTGLLSSLGLRRDAELAEWLGVSPQAVSQARKKGRVPDGWLIRIAAATGTSLDMLAFGESSEDAGDDADLTSIPLVSARLSAGGGSLETEGRVLDHYTFQREWIERKGNPDDMVLMRVSGDSMEPTIFHNDLVLVDQGKRQVVPHAVFAVGVDDGIYVKQLETFPGHHLVLRSFNERYSPIDIDMNGDLADSVRIIGRVIWWCHEV